MSTIKETTRQSLDSVNVIPDIQDIIISYLFDNRKMMYLFSEIRNNSNTTRCSLCRIPIFYGNYNIEEWFLFDNCPTCIECSKFLTN